MFLIGFERISCDQQRAKIKLIEIKTIQQVEIPYLNAPSKAKKSAWIRSSNRASASNAVVLPIAESLLRLNLCLNWQKCMSECIMGSLPEWENRPKMRKNELAWDDGIRTEHSTVWLRGPVRGSASVGHLHQLAVLFSIELRQHGCKLN